MRGRGRPRHPDILTPREWEVLSLLREGLSNERIAEHLGVTLSTARFHVSEILGKLGVASREEAAKWTPTDDREPRSLFDAGAILTTLRRVSTPALAAGTVAASIALVVLLAWGVVTIRDHRDEDAQAQDPAWMVDVRGYDAPSTMTFDLAKRQARRIDTRGDVGYAQWVTPGTTFVARTVRGTEWGTWQLDDVGGASIREVAPPNAAVDSAEDGSRISIVTDGNSTILDTATGDEQPIRQLEATTAIFSPDGSRIAYRFVHGGSDDNSVHDFVNVMVAGRGDPFGTGAGAYQSAMAIAFQRESSGYLNLPSDAWSPDGSHLLIAREAGCETGAPGCVRRLVFEVYGTSLTGDVIWHDYEGQLISAEWAGPGRLFVIFAGDAADPAYPSTRKLLVTLGIGKHSVPAEIEASCCVSFSPDGQYAVVRVGADAGERCALFAVDGWTEVVALHPTAADANSDFCGYVDWSPDGLHAIASHAGN